MEDNKENILELKDKIDNSNQQTDVNAPDTEPKSSEDNEGSETTTETNDENKLENENPISIYKLHDAAQQFDAKEIENLISSGYDVNEKYDEGYNAIHTMLQRYVELNLVEQIHAKPQFIEILSILARNGIDINSVDNAKQTGLHFIASQGNYPDIIKPLLAAGIRVNIQDARSQTALQAAILRGHASNVQTFVEGGADLDVGDNKGETALHMLCKGKRKLKLVQLLIKCNANVNSRDHGRRVPLHTACKNNRAEVVRELLISGAKVNARDSSGQSPLHYAAKFDMTGDIVAELLKYNAKINIQDGIADETPLHKSITYGTVEAFKILIQNQPAPNPNIKDAFGETVLHKAANCKSIYIWKQLLKLGGNFNVTNDNEYTVVQKALRVKNSEALSLMREYGAYVSVH